MAWNCSKPQEMVILQDLHFKQQNDIRSRTWLGFCCNPEYMVTIPSHLIYKILTLNIETIPVPVPGSNASPSMVSSSYVKGAAFLKKIKELSNYIEALDLNTMHQQTTDFKGKTHRTQASCSYSGIRI